MHTNKSDTTTIKRNETMAYVINPDLCMACGTCQGECPTGAINEGDVYSIDANICIDCGTCALS